MNPAILQLILDLPPETRLLLAATIFREAGIEVWTTNDDCVLPGDSEESKAIRDPLAWLQRWTYHNGKVELMCNDPVCDTVCYTVLLWVEGEDRPMSTGVAPDLKKALLNAVKGVASAAQFR